VNFTNLSIHKVGTYQLFAENSTGTISQVSNTITVSVAAPALLSFVTQPGNVTAGNPISAVVQVTDKYGNAEPAGISVAIKLTTGTLTSGTTSVATDVSGQATFSDLIEDKPGTYRLSASVSGTVKKLSKSLIVSA
jgi:hypothetical protein